MWKKLLLLAFWTAFYALAAMLFFHFAFDFDIWLARHWRILSRATIRGLPGLAFGVSLIAAVPFYIASIRYIWKKGKLPFTPPKFFAKKKPAAQVPTPEIPSEPKQVFPEILPDELKEPYIRIHSGILSKNAVDFIMTNVLPVGTEIVETVPDAMMPLPESFDTAREKTPVFKDMDFDAPSPIMFTEEDGEKVATYIFDDPDFWVADDTDDWFATGKQIASPIRLLLAAEADRRVLILGAKNIMDIDNLIPKWEEKGIEVITE